MLKMRLLSLLLVGVLLVDALALECVPRKNCPSITGSEYAHSAWYPPPIRKGEDFQVWQVFNTIGRASDLHVHWRRTPYPLNCSTVNINTSVIDNYINASITVYNATVLTDGSCSDEGEYQLVVSNNCTCNDTIIFHLRFISPCTPDSPPSPAGPRTVVVLEPRPGDPKTFCLTMSYVGIENNYDTRWQLGDEGNCSKTVLCTDNDFIQHGQYKCSSTLFGQCTFLSKLCMANYTKSLSGNYSTLACPVSGSSSTYHPSNATTLNLHILGWPRLIQWPGDTVSTIEGMATLTYQLSNYSREFLDLKFYNSSEVMDVSLNQVIICENTNCETVTIHWTVPAEGEYKMCYNFSGEVDWTLREDSPPEYKVPNCTQVTKVKSLRAVVIGVSSAALAIIVLLIIVICVCIKCWQKRRKKVQQQLMREVHVHTTEISQQERAPLLAGDKGGRSSISGGENLTLPVDLGGENLTEALDVEKDSPGHRKPQVFILSPRNPNEYIHIMPPPELHEHPEREDILTKYREEVRKNKAKSDKEIAEHQEKIANFAARLEVRGIIVTGVHQLIDTAMHIVVQWADQHIKESDFVILVITPSFSKFLESPPPSEEEYIFGASGGYVSSLLHNPPEGVAFLCVFLNPPKNMDFLPTTLRGSTLYEPLASREQFEQFYTVLTKPSTASHR